MDTILKEAVLDKCRDLSIPVFGIASAEQWNQSYFEPWVPVLFRPRSIFPEVKSVIVIGFPVILPILETAPSIHYHELYKTLNRLLDADAYLISLFLISRGYSSISIPRDGYGSVEVLKNNPLTFFSHRHAAFLAGLGTFGINNTILTENYGPRVRFASVFTTAELPPDPPLSRPVCIKCMRCVKACPVQAIPGEEYPEGLINKNLCASRSESLSLRYISPCGICIKVCPVGKDRDLHSRKNLEIYNEDSIDFKEYHSAWKHVRSYGRK